MCWPSWQGEGRDTWGTPAGPTPWHNSRCLHHMAEGSASFPGLYPLNTRNTPLRVTTKNSSRHCQMSLRGQRRGENYLQLRTTDLKENQPSNQKGNKWFPLSLPLLICLHCFQPGSESTPNLWAQSPYTSHSQKLCVLTARGHEVP